MTNQKDIFSLIKSLIGQANILTIPRVFITYMGNLEGALMLSQIIYWSDRSKDPDGWFYKSYAEWEDETGLSKHKVNRAINQIKSKDGILKTKVKRIGNGNTILHYQIDFDRFISRISEFLTSESAKSSLPYILAETTYIPSAELRDYPMLRKGDIRRTYGTYKRNDVNPDVTRGSDRER